MSHFHPGPFNGGGPGLGPGLGPRGGTVTPTTSYADVICLTIIVYDLMLTFPLEVNLIWGTRWNLTKILYLLSRYCPIFFFIIYLIYDVRTRSLPRPTDWLLNANLVFVEALFSLRTWAVWNRNRWIGVLLLTLFLSLWITTLVLLILLQVGKLKAMIFSLVNFGMLTWFYFCTSTLMCLRAYRSSLLPDTSFMRMINLHGVLYYIFLFTLSLFSLIFAIVHGDQTREVLPRVLQLCFTIMVTRMTLSLREAGAQTVRAVNADDAAFMNISTHDVLNVKV